MASFRKEKINPIEFMAQYWPKADLSHIEYIPEMKRSDREYWIIRGGGHDGTQMFTWQMLQSVVMPILRQESVLKSKIIEDPNWIGMRYKIGPILLSTCYGMVDLKCGRYPGQTERARMAVICEKVFAK